MQATRWTSSTHEYAVSTIDHATPQRKRWWETAYTSVSWDYPPSPEVHYHTLLFRGASRSRFLRIAYLSTRERSNTPTSCASSVSLSATSVLPPSPSTFAHPTSTTPSIFLPSSSRKPVTHLASIPPCPILQPCANARPRSTNQTSHTLKRQQPQWPKPPHYHASLLRSPLSRRKGLFRAVLPPDQAVDFFRRDVHLGVGVSLSITPRSRKECNRARTGRVDACASVQVAESVLEPYEAAAGFFGWHGLGIDVIRRVESDNGDEGVDEDCWSDQVAACRSGLGNGSVGRRRSSNLQVEMDEADVEEGRAWWTSAAEELVGSPGVVLQWVVADARSDEVTTSWNPAYMDVADAHASSSIALRREEVRWDPDIRIGPSRPSRPTSVSAGKRPLPPSSSTASNTVSASSSKPELKLDSSSAWWSGPSPHYAPPTIPHLLRFLPPSSVQYSLPSIQFSPWLPGGRSASAQGHGCWYGAQPIGAPSPMNHEPSLTKPVSPHSHIFATPVTPMSVHPAHSSRYSTKFSRGRDAYEFGRDGDRETETDHGYESTTTTADSDPPPHTPIGSATAPHHVESLQIHEDSDMEVHGVEVDVNHVATYEALGRSDPTTPVKLLDRFSTSTSLSVLPSSPGSNRDGHESSKAAVVFPSLNGSFRQGPLSHTSASPSSQGMSAQPTPVRTLRPVGSSSLLSAKDSTTRPSFADDDHSKTKLKSEALEPSGCSVSGYSPAFMLRVSSSPPTSFSPGLCRGSQGFWEPVTPISPSSSSSSLPLSPIEDKPASRPTSGWIGESTAPVPCESVDSSGAASSQCMLSAKSRSLSPSARHATSATSARSTSFSRPASLSSPTSTPTSASAVGSSYPSSPSPPNGSSLVPLNSTTLLPAFLAATSVKRKKASRTREIVDRLRSSSIDAGKGSSLGSDNLPWLAGPSASVGEEMDDVLGKMSSGSNCAVGNRVAAVLPPPPPSPPSRSNADAGLRSVSDLGNHHCGQTLGPKPSESGSSGSGGKKSNGTEQAAVPGSEVLPSLTHTKGITTTANTHVTPFPILTASQTAASNFMMSRQSQTGTATGRKPSTTTPSDGPDGFETNRTTTTPSAARGPGSHFLPSTPNDTTSPSKSPSRPPLPTSSSHSAVGHPPAPLGPLPPPAMLAVSSYPMYVSFPQYHAPFAPSAHQGQQGHQGTWLAVYPPAGLPPHLPVQGLVAQTHVAPITGVSGMRHASW